MRKRCQRLLFLTFLAALASLLSVSRPGFSQNNPSVASKPAQLAWRARPLIFEANHGQFDPRVDFVARGRGYTLFLAAGEAVLSLAPRQPDPPTGAADGAPSPADLPGPSDLAGLPLLEGSGRESGTPPPAEPIVLRMQFAGSNSAPLTEGLEELPGKVAYFIGSDPANWRANIPTYARVRYRDVYPGIDLVYYENAGELEFDLVVAPGANPGNIRLKMQGAESLELEAGGDVIMHARGAEVRLSGPLVYQEEGGRRRGVASGYALAGAGELSVRLDSYDRRRPLVIDPTVTYSTYLGGGGVGGGNDDEGLAIAVDASGNGYVTGVTTTPNFPVVNAMQPQHAGGTRDAFVTQFSPAGQILYSTYLGGNGQDWGHAIAVDASGDIYVGGLTESTDFPTTAGALDRTCGTDSLCGPTSFGNPGPSNDGFVVKLRPGLAAPLYATYLGGGDRDSVRGIAVDAAGNAYVGGHTGSTDFPVSPQAFDRVLDQFEGFVAKLNASGSSLLFSTFLGGSEYDEVMAIAIDGSGNSYVTGRTLSLTDFPLQNAFQTTPATAFVTKLDPTGSSLVYSTWLGVRYVGMTFGATTEGNAIAVDSTGHAYVTGFKHRDVDGFPTKDPIQPEPFGDGFVTKFEPSGSALVFSTIWEQGRGIAVDGNGNIYVAGQVSTIHFLLRNPITATDPWRPAPYITKFQPSGTDLIYSTYLAGEPVAGAQSNGVANGVAVDGSGNALVVGTTAATNFPVVNAAQPTGGFWFDAFVAKIFDSNVTCDWTLSPAGRTHGAAAGIGTFMVSAEATCGWAAESQAAWITITSGAGGTGDGTVGYSVAENATGSARTGTIAVNGRLFTITQTAGTCAFNLQPTSRAHGAGSETSTVSVVTEAGCAWIATSNADWITINSDSSGTGNGTVVYSVAANTSGSARTGTLTIAGHTFTVSQAAGAPGCASTISPTSRNHGAGAEAGTVSVVTQAGCAWTAASNVSWIGITSGSSGTGSGTVLYAVAANAGTSARSGTLTIAGQTFTVSQAAVGGPVTPTVISGGVVDAASFQPRPLVAGGIAAIFGTNLASTTAQATTTPLPTTMGGVAVQMNGVTARLFYVSPTQINFQAPWGLSTQSEATLTVSRDGMTSAPVSVSLAPARPAIFTMNGQGQGAIVVALTGQLAAPPESAPGLPARPVRRGEFISIYCTGLGLVTNPPADGAPALASPLSAALSQPSVAIGGQTMTGTFAGLAPGFVGLGQVNAQVPEAAPVGSNVPVALIVNGVISNTVFIAVQ